jgi:4-diphosphocytidyl-2C-methyl-D-erythritol kinase
LKLKGLIGLAVSALLIWWTLRGESLGEIWSILRTGDLWLLGASIFVTTAGFLLRAMRWRVLLLPVKRDTSLDSRFGAMTIGFMANNLLPARVGELVRVYAFSRMEAVSMSGTFGSVVVERLLDGVVLITFLLIPPLLPGFPAEGVTGGAVGGLIRGMVLALAVLLLLLAALLIWPARVVALSERLLARLPGKAAKRSVVALETFLEALQVLRRPALLVQAVLWSFAFWSWHALSFWLGMAAFGIHEGFLAAIFTEAAVGFGVALPSAPGFFGTFHAAAAWALEGVYGVEAARSLAFAYGFHLGGFFPVTFIGLWYARRIGLSFRDMGSSDRQVEQAVEAAHPLDVELDAPAKVNLYLRVLDREPTGYHGIETLFQALELSDRVRVTRVPGREIELEVVGLEAGPPEDNLVRRAAAAFLDAADLTPGLRIRLDKRIPAGAGLGGGSSDAAATLRCLDLLMPGAVSPERLSGIAEALGSDVPFFLCGSPLAVGEGRGERLRPLPPLPAVPVVVALPAVHVSTREAYAELDRQRARGVPVAGAEVGPPITAAPDWNMVQRMHENDFEGVILPSHPTIMRAREALLRTGPLFALLSGSGGAVFAIYRDADDARAALERLEPEEGICFVETRTRARMPDPERLDDR